MALDLPPVPPAGVTRAQISSALDAAAGVTLASPEAAVHLGNATTIEAVRQVVTAIRSGLLTVDTAVSAITGTTLPALTDAISDKADVATVSGLTQSLQTITEQLPDFARVGQIPSTPGEVGADPAGAAAAVQSLLTTGYATTTVVSDGLAGKVNVGTYNGRQTVIDAALSARPTVTEADARYATASALATAISDRLTQAAADARYATPTAVTAAVAGKLDLSAVRISADDPGVLELDILTSAPVVTVPVDPDPVPPVVTDPGTAVDALMPHPYYTPRTYTALIGGVSTTIADPYQPYPGDRPPSKNGQPIGRLAAPSLYGYPDETNTGIPAGVVLKPISGEIKVEDKGVTIGGVLTARPAAGAAAVTVGPVTLYPLAEPITHADAVLPVHNIFDGAMTDNAILRYGSTNVLVRRSMLRGNGRRTGVMENYGTGMFFAVDSRLDGGYNAEASIGEGGRYYLLRCNVTGGADAIQPRSVGCYIDFCYFHGTRIVETRHNDAVQIASSHLSASLAALFGGWNIRIRRCTAFSYGQKVGAQWLQFGDITADVRNVLVQDMLGFGGQYMYGFGFGKYYNGYGLNADGTPITKVSSLTGVAETHPWIRNVFLDGHTLGRKVVDGFPGGGGTTLAVPRYGLTAAKRSAAHFVGGLYGDPPPVSMRGIRWDDTSETAFADIGRTDWDAAATAEGLDFTRYTTGA